MPVLLEAASLRLASTVPRKVLDLHCTFLFNRAFMRIAFHVHCSGSALLRQEEVIPL